MKKDVLLCKGVLKKGKTKTCQFRAVIDGYCITHYTMNKYKKKVKKK